MIVSLSGKAGAGKGTVASYLAARHGFEIVSFAQPIKSMLITGLGLRIEDFTPERKEKPLDWLGKSPRQLAQTLGTEWGRNLVDRELWTTIAVRKVSELNAAGADVVIDDTRFDNEAFALMGMEIDAYMVKIIRPHTPEVAHHVSEHGLSVPEDLFHVIYNDGTVHQLHEQVDAMLGQLVPGADL